MIWFAVFYFTTVGAVVIDAFIKQHRNRWWFSLIGVVGPGLLATGYFLDKGACLRVGIYASMLSLGIFAVLGFMSLPGKLNTMKKKKK